MSDTADISISSGELDSEIYLLLQFDGILFLIPSKDESGGQLIMSLNQ